MGYIKHNAIIVTSIFDEDLIKAHQLAYRLFDGHVTEITAGTTNGYASFLVVTCGSKVGWEAYQDHEESRDKFFEELKTIDGVYDPGYPISRYLDVVEVRYGGDDDTSEILRTI
jgi:hypothetical protein